MRAVKEVVHAEDEPEVRVREDGVAGLGSFGDSFALEEGAKRGGELFAQAILVDDAGGGGNGGGVRQSRPGGKGRLLARGNVGNAQGDFQRARTGGGEASALGGRKMFANGVDGLDGRAAGDEQVVKLLEIRERNGGVERQLDKRRTSA